MFYDHFNMDRQGQAGAHSGCIARPLYNPRFPVASRYHKYGVMCAHGGGTSQTSNFVIETIIDRAFKCVPTGASLVCLCAT